MLTVTALWAALLFITSTSDCDEQQRLLIHPRVNPWCSVFDRIDGIGDPDTGITFMKSDFDDDFFAAYGVGHGCVIVKSGFKKQGGRLYPGFAFISPKNGKVYNNWRECKAGY